MREIDKYGWAACAHAYVCASQEYLVCLGWPTLFALSGLVDMRLPRLPERNKMGWGWAKMPNPGAEGRREEMEGVE